MNDTYTGWDGNTYPWPPPDGWYEASDGRWWAPGTGPAPPPSAEAPDPTGAGSTPRDLTAPAAETSQFEPLRDSPLILGQQQPAAGDFGPPNWDLGPSESSSRGGGRIAAVLLALVAVVAGGAAVAYFVFDIGRTGVSDELATSAAEDGSSSSETTETAETADGSDTAAGEATDPTGSDDDSTTESSPAASTSSLPGTTDSSEGTTTSTSAPVDVDAATAAFRELLAQNDLPTVPTDEQISTLGTLSCELASVSTEANQFETLVRQAIEEAGSPLEPDQLMQVSNAAVIAFCPDEADRLDLSL